MSFTLITEAVNEPITLDEAKKQCRIDADLTDEDELIMGFIKFARERAELVQSRQIIDATWNLNLDEFPANGEIKIEKPPLQSVTHVKYYDTDDVQQTFDPAKYEVDTKSEPGRIVLKAGESFPAVKSKPNAIEIQFVAGYGDDGARVPHQTKQGIRLLVALQNEHRGDDSFEIPPAIDGLFRSKAWRKII